MKVCVALLTGLVAVHGAFLAPEKEPLQLEVAGHREEREHREKQVADADRQIEALEDRRYKSTVEELESSARTVQAQAQAAAEEALGAERHVEELAMTQQVLLAKAKDFSAQQEAEVKYAEDSNKKLEKELEKAKAFAKTSDASAKDMAKGAVKQLFQQKFQQLQDWRDQVLTDHWDNGRRAALEAAEPYTKAMGVALEKAKSYQTTAKTLSTVATGLAEEANQATLTAAEKRMAGDVDGALRLNTAAQQMRSHGQKLRSYAKELQAESEHLSEAAPQYLSSAKRAAQRAEWHENPEALPPRTLGSSYMPA